MPIASKGPEKACKAPCTTPHHSVYVIELDRSVLQHKRFLARNPDYDPRKPCVYVGMTGLTVEQRFANHKNSIKSGSFVTQYGIRLKPKLYERLNPMSWEKAVEMEKLLAERLRRRGYAVWQA
jgi:hypothetical protein